LLYIKSFSLTLNHQSIAVEGVNLFAHAEL